jgi:hypothetical protein
MWTSYLDRGVAGFSGYIAADELYDGPFCVLSIVDNRTFKRLLYQVLDHDPDHRDITAFFHRFRMALRLRGLTLRGVTTDASPLYPEPLREVFGDVPHQVCEFHVIKELTKAILRAVAKVRKQLATRKPKLKRGRPSRPMPNEPRAKPSDCNRKSPTSSNTVISSSNTTARWRNVEPSRRSRAGCRNCEPCAN